MATITRSPYNGSSRKLVLAMDIGTTHSGVCYAFLEPGVVPQIKPVTTYMPLPLTSCADLTPDRHLEQILKQRLERFQNPVNVVLLPRREVLRGRGCRPMG